jgi:hypothetical protein
LINKATINKTPNDRRIINACKDREEHRDIKINVEKREREREK